MPDMLFTHVCLCVSVYVTKGDALFSPSSDAHFSLDVTLYEGGTCQPTQAVITKYHRLHDLNNRFISHSSGGGKPKIKVPANSVSQAGFSSWLEGGHLPTVSSPRRKRDRKLYALFLLGPPNHLPKAHL